MKELKRSPLGFFPTPLHKLEQLNKSYKDYQLFIKRDDQTGLALGGNKTRKLEYLFQDAFDNGCDTVITLGAAQSNHCRQTAAAASRLGMECHLLLRKPIPESPNGNFLLDILLGAHIHWFEREHMKEAEEKLINDLIAIGKKPYIIPIGGSNDIGTFGYFNAIKELKDQLKEIDTEIDYIVFASCSGGTHSGMVLGKKLFKLDAEILGISIEKDADPKNSLQQHIINITNEASDLINSDVKIDKEDVQLIQGYNEAGYGVVTDMEKNAIHMLAKNEGILLDPVYAGRAFAAFTDLLDKEYFPKGSNILFWHTGGAPANFHYANEIV